MKADTEPISFRATRQLLNQIDARREPFGISRGEFVRGLVMQSLAGSDAASLATQLEALLATTGKLVDESRSIKRDIAMSVFLLLMRVGDVPPEEAKKLVQDKLINLSKNPT